MREPVSGAARADVDAAGLSFPWTAAFGEAVASDRAWALKRDWTDSEFQAGADGNRSCLQRFEDELADRLRRASVKALGSDCAPPVRDGEAGSEALARLLTPAAGLDSSAVDRIREAVLSDPEVLGSALDIAGAYLKNYAVDKAASVAEGVLPTCRRRGGLWLLKALNHLATVRMKQARPEEALAALEEIRAHASACLDARQQEEAWEFWETVHRNFGWALSSLGREDEALGYIRRAVEVKERVGLPASWFDLWDLGRMQAALALRREDAREIAEAQALVTKALWGHRDAEPGDLVMRAKLWHSVGECSFALGHLAEGGRAGAAANPSGRPGGSAATHYRKALKCFREAHKLFAKTEGRHNPLTGGEAQAAAWALLKLGEDEEAKRFLLDALEALSRQQSGWGEGSCLDRHAPALLQAVQAVDRVLEAHRSTDDRAGLQRYFPALERLCSHICERLALSKDRADAAAFERLVSSCSMVMVASGEPEAVSRGQALLRAHLWEAPSTAQARLCNEMLRALPDAGGPGGGPPGPRLEALVQAMASASGGGPP